VSDDSTPADGDETPDAAESAGDETPNTAESAPATPEGEQSTPPDGLCLRGEVVGVERVPVSAVPDSFPVAVWTDEALAVRVAFDGYDGRARTYFSLPETDPDDRLAGLLSAHGVDDPADLMGRRPLFDVRDGHALPVTPSAGQRGDPRAFYGVLAGLAPSITIALFSFFGLGEVVFSPVYIALYLVCTFLVLPVSLYLDAWYLRTTTDWDGTPLRWALLAIVPPLYVVVTPYYLISRENARPLAL